MPERLKIVMVPPQHGMSNHYSSVMPAWVPCEPELMDEIKWPLQHSIVCEYAQSRKRKSFGEGEKRPSTMTHCAIP